MPRIRQVKVETVRVASADAPAPVHVTVATPAGLARLCDPIPLELSGYAVEQRPAKDVTCPSCSARWAKVCGCCGQPYTRMEWAALPARGVQHVPGALDIELKNCAGCDSTMGVEVLAP